MANHEDHETHTICADGDGTYLLFSGIRDGETGSESGERECYGILYPGADSARSLLFIAYTEIYQYRHIMLTVSANASNRSINALQL